MDRQELHNHLQQLHNELQNVANLSDEDKELLQKIEDDIQTLLNAKEVDLSSRYTGFNEGLREGIERFEANHPDLTMTMGQIAEILAKMGI
ncbi:MAG: DUF4404 family protein [Acidobacteriota bacterium]